ncbi:hypothetical protein SLEP1_g40728 [Rubroshorea leprosula]|uniref:Exostosin GT47 domain-containing protein n=1 Tax=Rubroshorea leprosula TaxID=152421 RepID=A0AAV5L4X3_9ROSI|nr:hypothetical protein SLEP1_g40728 [Rubroshorea leprosula]
MLSKKQLNGSPWTGENRYHKHKEPHFKFFTPQFKYILLFSLFLLTWFLILFQFWPPRPKTPTEPAATEAAAAVIIKKLIPSSCDGGASVYVYNLPTEFNLGLLRNCSHLSIYTSMCPHVANNGLGQPLAAVDLPGSDGDRNAWFATHQFIAEMIFHARVENHPCRTLDPSKADIFYVPFYGGLHASSMFREFNRTVRDELAVRLVDYLEKQPTWRKNNGEDHFIVLGRTAWDFMRSDSGPDFGANCLLNLPAVKKMSVMTVERNPWNGANLHGIPYASYFHPSTAAQMLAWQRTVRESTRPYLFSFIGAPRKGVEKAAIRDELIKQCAESTRCRLVHCDHGNTKCYDPAEILRIMKMSQFCLQAPGDSFTRRSTFDSILTGCIPVFFSPHMAYTQYGWFLPEEKEEYSVYMDEKEVTGGKRIIEEELMRIPAEKVERMRSTVINMIPRVTYSHPNASSGELGFKDAVDVALDALAKHVRGKIQKEG